MNNSIEEGAKLSNLVMHGSIFVRIIGVYLWLYFFVTFVSLFFTKGFQTTIYFKFLDKTLPNFIDPFIFIASIPAFLFIVFFEFLRYRYSKKHNLPRWKDATLVLVEREFEKQKLDEIAYMRKQAQINYEINKKNSLDYWFDMKQKGAITSEEYEKKKNELLLK